MSMPQGHKLVLQYLQDIFVFYYLQEEMGLALNRILDRVCSNNIENLKNDIAITWINYKSENNHIHKGFGFGINNRKLIYPASIVKLVYGLSLIHISEPTRPY